MEAYHQLDVDRATDLLEQALHLGSRSPHVTYDKLALTHRNLAVVSIGARNDIEAGHAHLLQGLCADPTLALDPLTSTPQIQAVFQRAQADVDLGACPESLPPQSVAAGPLDVLGHNGPGAAAAPRLPEPAPDSTPLDDEVPWKAPGAAPPPGSQASTASTRYRAPQPAADKPRFFVQLGFTVGLTWPDNGMKADRSPPSNQVFGDLVNDTPQYVDDPLQTFVDGQNGDEPTFRLPDPNNLPELLGDWAPDADSEDYLYANADGTEPEPYGGPCTADGTRTGPEVADPETGEGLLPSKYCVRVKNPGLTPGLAVRSTVGYFITDAFSVAALGRFQFEAGKGTLSHVLLGTRAEWAFLRPQGPRGLMLSTFIGATVGQIQATVSKDDNGPWAVVGLYGAHAGLGLRYRFHRHVGAFIAPEVDLFFPDTAFHIDIPAGLELAF